MDKRAEVEAWLLEFIQLPNVNVDLSDILGSVRYAGDDAHEMMRGFAKRFGVDMSDFDPWQHYDADEPPNWQRYRPYSLDGKELPLLPITVVDLTHAANLGRWTPDYSGREVRFVKFSWVFFGKVILCGMVVLALSVVINTCLF